MNAASAPVWEELRPWPTLDAAACYGLAGDVVRTLGPETEADPAALLVIFLVAFGNAVGDGAHVRAGGARHPARLFAALVGGTGRVGRKGQAQADVEALLERVDAAWLRAARESGLASGEGFVKRFADCEGKVVEKRALFVEAEFARTLAAAQRDGSTLSAVLRDAWDSGSFGVLTRTDPLKATGVHASVIVHVTPEELRARLTTTEIANGFANRFLFVCVRRSKSLPAGGNLTNALLDPVARRVREALDAAHKRTILRRTAPAEARWAEIYNALPSPPGLLGALTARADAQLLRLALVYALLDQADAIDVPHLEAACALWRYAEASVAHLFGGILGDDLADRLLADLRTHYPEGLDREAQFAQFRRHVTAAQLAAARDVLVAHGLAEERSESSMGPGASGRPRLVLYAVPGTAKKAKKGHPEGVSSLSSLSSPLRPPGSAHHAGPAGPGGRPPDLFVLAALRGFPRLPLRPEAAVAAGEQAWRVFTERATAEDHAAALAALTGGAMTLRDGSGVLRCDADTCAAAGRDAGTRTPQPPERVDGGLS